ncbi:MAG: RagB/SusD family nutrient uptake outer membrane protein, partial [Dysgonamonadaceae bacterium]|nr:RagB/SusD family nutrient uptake outer membrane protein [Dysgonamonadaceae bacterium]
IGNANDAIEQIEATPDSVKASANYPLSTVVKKKAIASAKFIRALSYHYLVQTYGKVPLVLKTDDKELPRASVEDVYKQIVKDLEEARVDLPKTSNNKSQPSISSTDALLARVYLSWAQVGATQDNAKLEKAVEYANNVIETGEYILIKDFTQNVGRYYKNGPELLFTFSHEFGQSGRDGGNHQSHCSFTFAFDYTEEYHIGLSDIELYNRWDDLDQRKEYSYSSHLVHPETKEVWEFLPPTTLPPFGKGIDRSYERGLLDSPYERDFDRNEIRYAEVLLIKAEALNELNRTAEAYEPLNQIRRRAYAFQSDPAAFDLRGLSQAEFRTALQKEREHEFIYESKRWIDLVRWKKLIQTVKSVQDFADYKEYGGDYQNAPGILKKSLIHLHAKVKNVGIQHYLFPIPKTALESNPNLTQNYGYDGYGHTVEASLDPDIYK